ncbi:hypothetical protein ACWCV9_35035 [Streptomyces sp. NPDC001606]
MPQELTAQEQFDVFADDVAWELGTHCRTAPLPEYSRGLARLIVDLAAARAANRELMAQLNRHAD